MGLVLSSVYQQALVSTRSKENPKSKKKANKTKYQIKTIKATKPNKKIASNTKNKADEAKRSKTPNKNDNRINKR